MASVRGLHAAGALGSIESNRIAFLVRTPERSLETLRQRPRFCLQPVRLLMLSQPPGGTGGKELGRINVALHLGKRDRSLGKPSIDVEDGVERILPALIG